LQNSCYYAKLDKFTLEQDWPIIAKENNVD